MIIKSVFKDYYDHIEHITGGDPKVVYIRHRLKPLKDMGDIHLPQFLKFQFNLHRSLPHSYSSKFQDCNFKWCIVAGKYYLIVEEHPTDKPIKPWTIVTPESDIMKRLCPDKKSKSFLDRDNKPELFFGTSNSSAIELCRLLNQPVFVVENGLGYLNDQDQNAYHRKRVQMVTVCCELPILKDLGFASVIPAEIMYQDIAYFMSNTIRTNPDISPPVEIGNLDKIVGHGFDLRESFRHRKAL